MIMSMYVFQWAKIIIVLERSYSPRMLLEMQQNYSVPFTSQKNEQSRGLMVIKTTVKTRALEMKTALGNWRVSWF